MKKGKILIASVLKPVNEPRMLARMGKSLQAEGNEIYLFGSGSVSKDQQSGIRFFGWGTVKRFSIKRLFIPWKMLMLIYKVKPDILIVNTHELLIVAILGKILFGCKIIYDIQENYFRNIWYTNTFPPVIKHLLAIWVRIKEYALVRFFNHIILAENCYSKEMDFLRGLPFTVLENKLAYTGEIPPRKRSENSIKLLFTGTLAESTGIFEAIALAKGLHAIDKQISLCIAGFCSQPSTLKKIRASIKGQQFIELIGGDAQLAHAHIIERILKADFGIIAYPKNPSTSGSIPSKLYEYLALQLPILYLDNAPWKALIKEKSAGLPFNESSDLASLLQAMKSSEFFTSPTVDALWSTESTKLVELINKLFR